MKEKRLVNLSNSRITLSKGHNRRHRRCSVYLETISSFLSLYETSLRVFFFMWHKLRMVMVVMTMVVVAVKRKKKRCRLTFRGPILLRSFSTRPYGVSKKMKEYRREIRASTVYTQPLTREKLFYGRRRHGPSRTIRTFKSKMERVKGPPVLTSFIVFTFKYTFIYLANQIF